MPDVDPRALRAALRMERPGFERAFGIPARTLQDWEQGRRQPDRTALAYLRAIAAAPQAVREAYAAGRLIEAKAQPSKRTAAFRAPSRAEASTSLPGADPPGAVAAASQAGSVSTPEQRAPARHAGIEAALRAARAKQTSGLVASGPTSPPTPAPEPAPPSTVPTSSARVEQILTEVRAREAAAERPKIKAPFAVMAHPAIRP